MDIPVFCLQVLHVKNAKNIDISDANNAREDIPWTGVGLLGKQ